MYSNGMMSSPIASLTQNEGGDDEKNPEDRGLHILSYLCENMRGPVIYNIFLSKAQPRIYSESHTTTTYHVRQGAEARRGGVASRAPATAYTDGSNAGVIRIPSSVSPLGSHSA